MLDMRVLNLFANWALGRLDRMVNISDFLYGERCHKLMYFNGIAQKESLKLPFHVNLLRLMAIMFCSIVFHLFTFGYHHFKTSSVISSYIFNIQASPFRYLNLIIIKAYIFSHTKTRLELKGLFCRDIPLRSQLFSTLLMIKSLFGNDTQ